MSKANLQCAYAAKARQLLREIAALQSRSLTTPSDRSMNISLLTDEAAVDALYVLMCNNIWSYLPDKCLIRPSQYHPYEMWHKDYAIWVAGQVVKNFQA